jgi:hypothetical protein
VTVVWGIKVLEPGPFELFPNPEKDPTWERDPTFNPVDPWAQRAMLAMSTNMPQSLKVVYPDDPEEENTWVEGFKIFLETRDREFPSRNFQADMREFFVDWSYYDGSFLLDEATQDILATSIQVKVLLRLFGSVTDNFDAQEAWDDWVEQRNEAAGHNAKNAWHCSKVWVMTEARVGVVTSTVSAILISIVCGFVVAAVSTKSVWLAVLAMVSPFLTVLSMFFVMCCLAGWSVGVIEAIALIVFLGYMFTFNLHVVHAYSHVPQRELAELSERSDLLKEDGVGARSSPWWQWGQACWARP